MASITRLIKTLPLPLFGSLQTATTFTLAKSRALPRLAGWALPLTAGALWFVWPAVDDDWKIEMGFQSDPEAALKAAEEARAAEVAKKSVPVLPAEFMEKVEGAYNKAHNGGVEVTEEDVLLVKAAGTGDFTYLEEKWEAFNEKAIRPGEDDDEDEDDDDDEEEDEEEEEEEDE